ncbi:thioredoxin family protein [Aequorivita sp. CIP111184]|uniref:thioredoxin family protein n=1 Tax=Aequorivita sp. CIP111184 TaxID=2211356 RepID=UPI000DBC100B|nr:thioredoxin family protein [Aequorivita sp. CIP111184]SRX54390.1 Thiol-disulfide oxidoreductase ResA [Aequorivita sp. CIP111184]
MKTIKILSSLAFALIAITAFNSCKNEQKKNLEEVAINENDDANNISPDSEISVIGYKIGDEATDFKLKDVNGKMVSLSDYPDAKGFIVIFTCNTCPFAVASEERIVALDKEFKSKGYPVIAINPNNPEVQEDDTYELMQQKAKEAGFTFPYLYDESQSIYAKYGATKTPHVYLLQKEDGSNIVKYIGAIDDNVRNASAVKEQFLANAVNELLEGKQISVKETKAIGCSVKQ